MTSRSDTRSAVRQLVSSHKHLLAAFRAQTEEIGILRRYILELRAQHAPADQRRFYRRFTYPPQTEFDVPSPTQPNDWPRL